MPSHKQSTITRRRAIGATGSLFLGAGLLGSTVTPPVAAAPLDPSDELAALLDRAGELLLHPDLQDPRGDLRMRFYEPIDVLLDMAQAADPRALWEEYTGAA
jgi:hypothetical protein